MIFKAYDNASPEKGRPRLVTGALTTSPAKEYLMASAKPTPAPLTPVEDDGLAVVVNMLTRPQCKRRRCRNTIYARGLCHRHWTPLPKLNPADRIEDVCWMLDTGESPQMCCIRLGLKAHTLARWLDRHGRPELARTFYSLDKQAAA